MTFREELERQRTIARKREQYRKYTMRGGSGRRPGGFTVLAVNLSGTTLNMPAANAGDLIGAITTTTIPPGHTSHTPVTLSGPDAALFAITNGGIIPCNLIVGGSNIPARSYSISLTAT